MSGGGGAKHPPLRCEQHSSWSDSQTSLEQFQLFKSANSFLLASHWQQTAFICLVLSAWFNLTAFIWKLTGAVGCRE